MTHRQSTQRRCDVARTVVVVVVAVLAAAGVTLSLLAPDDSQESASLRVAPGSVELAGRF